MGTVRITEVKSHADEGMVLDGRVREVDRFGNDAADEAADFAWYPVILDLDRFFMVISLAVVNHGGRDGTSPDPLVWSAGTLPKRRRWFMRFKTGPFCLGHLVFGIRNGCVFLHLPFVLRVFLIGPIFLVSWSSGVAFLGTLHWPAGGLDLGFGGISYVELLTLYELWAGERLSLEKAHPRYLRPGRPISVSVVPFWSWH